MCVITTMRNCATYVDRCIGALQEQMHPFDAVVIDDCSDDGTWERAQARTRNDRRFALFRNTRRRTKLDNVRNAIERHDAAPDDVLVNVDGDDWLSGPHALATLFETCRARPRLRMTYGQFAFASSGAIGFCAPYPDEIKQLRRYRQYPWVASHPRTFRRELWSKIRWTDLLDPTTARPWRVADDVATAFPMLEMCAPDEIGFVGELLYVYNDMNPLRDKQLDGELHAGAKRGSAPCRSTRSRRREHRRHGTVTSTDAVTRSAGGMGPVPAHARGDRGTSAVVFPNAMTRPRGAGRVVFPGQ